MSESGGSFVFSSLPDRLKAESLHHPEQRALIQDERIISFAELDAEIDRVAATLQANGLAPQDVVALCAANSISYVMVFVGALRAGLAVAPLAPSSTAVSLAGMVLDCDARIVFVDAASAAHLAPVMSRIPAEIVTFESGCDCTRFDDWLAPSGSRPVPVTIDPDWVFNIIYSSGTTGMPKGITQPHVMRTPWEPPGTGYGYGRNAVTIVSTGLYSNTTLSSLFPALGGGGTVVLMDRFDVLHFLELSERWAVTHAMLVPVQYQRILALPDFDRFDLSAYRMKFSTSAPLSTVLKGEILRRWPGGLTEYYGMTETGGGTVLYAHETPDKLHTVGRPWPYADVRLIAEDGSEVSGGAVGEVVSASPIAMIGYHNQPEKTAEATWYSPDGRRFIRHGDVGRFDEDGFLVLMDRKKDMIISGGFNIFPSDLEGVLRQHPAVSDATVVGVSSEAWGETPVGFVTISSGLDAGENEIRDWANARLGKVQRLSAIRILDVFPRSHIGKVLKRELRQSYETAQSA